MPEKELEMQSSGSENEQATEPHPLRKKEYRVMGRREFLSMSAAVMASAPGVLRHPTSCFGQEPSVGPATQTASTAAREAPKSGVQTLTTGEYSISLKKGKKGIAIFRGATATNEMMLKMYPCAGNPDWELFNAERSSEMKRESSGTVDRVVMKTNSPLGICTLTVSVDSSVPGLIHSQVEIEPNVDVPAASKFFSGRTPELRYASGKALAKLIYYLNGMPGTSTYHTVAGKPSAILDNNQWVYYGDPFVLKSTVLYCQDFSSLSQFFEASGTRIRGTVTQPPGSLESIANPREGNAPFGYALPKLRSQLSKGVKVKVCSSLLFLSPGAPSINNSVQFCSRFVESVSAIYTQLTRPSWKMIEWPAVVEKGLNDLNTQNVAMQQYRKRSSHPDGSDHGPGGFAFTTQCSVGMCATPIVVQSNLIAIKQFSQVFSSKAGVNMVRHANVVWQNMPVPTIAFNDAWQYLYGLAMAADYATDFDDADARAYCMKSADSVIEAGRHLHYEFPFEVDKTLTPLPKVRFEYDCAGAYVYLMMRYHQFTGEDRYLREARAAADRVLRSGFEFAYEFTTTSLTPVALLRLYIQTKDKRYLDGISIPLALIVRHSWFFNPGYREYLGRTIFMLTEGMPGVYANGWEEGSLIRQLSALLSEGHSKLPLVQRDLIAELLHWKAVSIADSLPDRLPNPSIISTRVPIEWPLPVNRDWSIPMEGFGYLEWDDSGRYQKPGSVSQAPYNFGMLPDAALMLFHPLGHGGMLYADAPIVYETQVDGTVEFAAISSQRESQAYVAGRSMTVSIQSDDGKPPLRGAVEPDGEFWFSIVPGKRYRLSIE